MSNENKREEWLYYYALYHMIAHWSALMVTIGLLLTIWAAVALAGTPPRGSAVLLPAIAVYAASLWFNYRMYVFSNFVHSKIEPDVRSIWSIPHPGANILAFLLTSLLFVADLWHAY